MSNNRTPDPPRLLAISDGRVATAGEEPFRRWLRALATSGVDAVQLREKELDDRGLFALGRQARMLLPASVLLVVNGRADIALAVGAGGVHLPSDGVPAQALRNRFPNLRIGVSTHRLDEVEAAHEAGADWVAFGPVYPTPGKAAYGPPPGIEGLRRAAEVGIPVLALGGLRLERLPEVRDAGAAGVAGIRMFADPDSLPALVTAARRTFPRESR